MSKALVKHLTNSITTFVNDPPDSDYQRGYLAALVELYRAEHMRLADQASRLLERFEDHQSNGRQRPLGASHDTP